MRQLRLLWLILCLFSLGVDCGDLGAVTVRESEDWRQRGVEGAPNLFPFPFPSHPSITLPASIAHRAPSVQCSDRCRSGFPRLLLAEPPSCRRQIGSRQLWSALEVKFAFARALWIFRFASFQTRLSTFFPRGVFSPPGPVSGRICLRWRHHFDGKGGQATVVRGKPFLGGRFLSETVPSCWGYTESGVLDGINSNSNHLPTLGQPHVDWSIGVGVRFSSPPNLSVVVGRQISNDIDAGRYGAAGRGDEDGGYLRSPDPQIRQKFRLDAGVLSESRADQPRYVGTMSVDLVVHRLAFVINNLETPNSPASSTAVQHWGAPSRFRGSSKQPTFQTDSRHGRGSETCAHLETAPPPNTKKEGKTTPKKHHSISVLTTLPRLIPSNINHTRSQESGLPFLRVAAPPSPPPPPAPPGVLEKKHPNNPLFFFPSTHPPTHPQCPQLSTQRSTQHAGSPGVGIRDPPPSSPDPPRLPFPFSFSRK